jgi:hypothetical protein
MNAIRTFDDLKEAIIDQLRARYPSQAPSLPFGLSLPTGKTLTLTLEPGDEGAVGVATLTLPGDPPERLRVTRNDTDRSKLQINGGPPMDLAGAAADIATLFANLADANATIHRS